MALFTGVTSASAFTAAVHLSSLLSGAPPIERSPSHTIEYVGLPIVRDVEAVVLAVPGLPRDGRLCRFRSLDTSDLPQPIIHATLSASGSKLLLQPADAPAVVIDLTQQHEHNHAAAVRGSARRR